MRAWASCSAGSASRAHALHPCSVVLIGPHPDCSHLLALSPAGKIWADRTCQFSTRTDQLDCVELRHSRPRAREPEQGAIMTVQSSTAATIERADDNLLKAYNAKYQWHPMVHPKRLEQDPPLIIARGRGAVV